MSEHIGLDQLRKDFYRLTDLLDVGTINYEIVRDCLKTARISAMQLDRISIRECNGVRGPDGFMKWDDSDQAKADRDRTRCEKRVTDALSDLFDSETFKRIEIEFQSDPRGAPVYVHIKNGPQHIMSIY